MDAVGKEGIIRKIDEVDGVNILKLFGTWVFEDGVEKYWVAIKDKATYTRLVDVLKNDRDVNIIGSELIDVSTQGFKNLPNVFGSAIEILDLNDSIKTDLSLLMEELALNSYTTQEVKEADVEKILDTIDEHEKTTEAKNLIIRLLIEIFLKWYIG